MLLPGRFETSLHYSSAFTRGTGLPKEKIQGILKALTKLRHQKKHILKNLTFDVVLVNSQQEIDGTIKSVTCK